MRPKKKGRKKSLESKTKKNANVQASEAIPVDTGVEHIKQLEDELLKLSLQIKSQ